MLKMRLGATPVVEVKIPLEPPSVRRSSQWAQMVGPVKVVLGRHALAYAVVLLTNWMLPLLERLAVLYELPYIEKAKGRVRGVTVSSPWLPASSSVWTMEPVD